MKAAVKKIYIDAHVLTGKRQGTNTVLWNIIKEIEKLPNADEYTILLPKGADMSALHVERARTLAVLETNRVKRLVWGLPRLIKRDKPDFVISQYAAPFSLGARHIVFMHDFLPFSHSTLFPFAFRLRFKILCLISLYLAEKIICVSEFTRSEGARIFPQFSNKFTTIHNGPSFPSGVYTAALPPPKSASRPFILSVGRIEARKNIGTLIKSFITADLDDVDLVIVGNRDLNFELACDEHPQIRFISNASNEELIRLYRSASLFVYPSLAEGFGLPLLDALLFRCPVISSNTTSLAEVAENLATYFDPYSVTAIETLGDLISGHFRKEPVPRPSEEDIQHLLRKFSWEKVILKMSELLS